MSSVGQEETIDFDALRQQPSSTPDDERPRCPDDDCGSLAISRRGDKYCSPEEPASDDGVFWKCKRCKGTFDEPDWGGSP